MCCKEGASVAVMAFEIFPFVGTCCSGTVRVEVLF